jgi:hypothetical protein
VEFGVTMILAGLVLSVLVVAFGVAITTISIVL